MKVLRLYDHLGELKKEFNLYVEGEDFKWQSSYPEPVWLGTITLEDASKEPEKPSEVASEPLQLEPDYPPELDYPPDGSGKEMERSLKEAKQEEVKDVPKNHDRKRSRVKRSAPSASPESTEGLHQDDPGGDTPKGD